MRERRAPVVLATTLVLAAVLVSGCAGIPTGVSVQSTPTPPAPGASGNACCQLIVGGPQANWSARQIVEGFLLASTSFAHDHAIAREYLTPTASRLWQPGSQVTILHELPPLLGNPHLASVEGSSAQQLTVPGQPVATLNASGQYLPALQGPPDQFAFQLQREQDGLRIAALPGADPGQVSHELLLIDSFFSQEYTARDLYYYVPRDHELVPDPVFVPTEAADPLSTLLNDLLHGPSGWLADAAVTDFPAHAQFMPVHVLPNSSGGKTAFVDVHLPVRTPSSQIQVLVAQLRATLTFRSYGLPLFQTAQVKVNGQPWPRPPRGASRQGTHNSGPHLPRWPVDPPVYFLLANGSSHMLTGLTTRPTQLADQTVALSRIAVSPDGTYFAGVGAGNASDHVYTAVLNRAIQAGQVPRLGNMNQVLSGASFSSLSWDSGNDLWVAGQRHNQWEVWVVSAADGQVTQVNLPARLGPVTALRVAPDGVRVAMIVGSGNSAHLAMSAVAGSGAALSLTQPLPLGPNVSDVSLLTWYDEDHLLAVTRSGPASRLWEVPVNGNDATPLSELTGIQSITAAAGSKNPLYASISGGRLVKSIGLGEPWTYIAPGEAATYAG
ncbi:MAG TPA: LpqB family beta-propeller domain-containing protein [Streptosporangiaceae bacterium]|nr:LpqB family beta-propeller domain-containing protein [Streptosporangiaceae bacterium]